MLCNKSRLESAFFQQNMLATNPKVEMLRKSWSPIRWLLQPIKVFRIFQRQCVWPSIKTHTDKAGKTTVPIWCPKPFAILKHCLVGAVLFFGESGLTTLSTLLGRWQSDPKCAGSGSLQRRSQGWIGSGYDFEGLMKPIYLTGAVTQGWQGVFFSFDIGLRS